MCAYQLEHPRSVWCKNNEYKLPISFFFSPFATDQIQSASAPRGCISWHFNTPNRLMGHDSSADPFPKTLHFPHWQIRQTSLITAQPSLKPSRTDRDLTPSIIWWLIMGNIKNTKPLHKLTRVLRQHKQCQNCWQLCRVSGCCRSQRRRQVSGPNR